MSGESQNALSVWEEKLDFLLREEAVASDPSRQFELRKKIEEAKEKIRELGAAYPSGIHHSDPPTATMGEKNIKEDSGRAQQRTPRSTNYTSEYPRRKRNSTEEDAAAPAALTKASISRRLVGTVIEYLTWTLVFSPTMLFPALFEALRPLLLFMMVLAHDAKAGKWSIKRVGKMRVIDRKTRKAISFQQAVQRNCYYLFLVVILIASPSFNSLFVVIFLVMVFIDILLITFDPRGRRLGDFLTGTQVISVNAQEI